MYKLWLNTTYHANYETQWSWLWLIAYKLCNHKVRCGEIFFLFEINPLQLGILTHLYGHIQKKNGWITLDIVQKTKSGLIRCSLWLQPNELEKKCFEFECYQGNNGWSRTNWWLIISTNKTNKTQLVSSEIMRLDQFNFDNGKPSVKYYIMVIT